MSMPLRTTRSLVQRPLSQTPNAPILRYTILAPRIAQLTRSIIAMHVFGGVVALIIVLLAIEWTLRRRLLLPIAELKLQLESLCREGWFDAVPGLDEELAELQLSLGDVGPAVSGRTAEWMRRAAEHDRPAIAAATTMPYSCGSIPD